MQSAPSNKIHFYAPAPFHCNDIPSIVKMTTSANSPDSGSLQSRPKPGDEPANKDLERELLIFRAQLCEQSNRFDDMMNIMNEICQTYGDLSEEERNLLSCAYKNVIGSRRTSWRIINENLQQPQQSNNSNIDTNKTSMAIPTSDSNSGPQQLTTNGSNNKTAPESSKYDVKLVQSVLKTIEAELRLHCSNIIDILTNRLIPSNVGTGESRVFYYKMKGDYMRYLCEISTASERKEKANESLLAYKAASDKAMIELPPTHPVRLGLMLNFSVFYYDIMKSPERSCRLAKQAFDDAIAELDTLSEESYRDSTIIMQLLRDNLLLWESEQSIHSNNNIELSQG